MEEKQCMKCGIIKPLSEFYSHKYTADGHLNKCKMCTKSDVHKNYKMKAIYYREYDKERFQNNFSRREAHAQRIKTYYLEHPLIRKAHYMVHNALRGGKLIKQPCEICGSNEHIEAHHEDYSKPLDVIWLCSVHHKWVHA